VQSGEVTGIAGSGTGARGGATYTCDPGLVRVADTLRDSCWWRPSGGPDLTFGTPGDPTEVAAAALIASIGADNQHGMIFCMAIPAHHRPHIRTAVLRARGTVTIPQDVRERLDLAEGDQFVITVEEDRIVLTPTSVIPDDQAWFWMPEWQAKEAEADEAAANGERGTVFGSGEEFLAFLDENMKPGR
jgi:AbrB family looped-hinge helix DNA binding protein